MDQLKRMLLWYRADLRIDPIRPSPLPTDDLRPLHPLDPGPVEPLERVGDACAADDEVGRDLDEGREREGAFEKKGMRQHERLVRDIAAGVGEDVDVDRARSPFALAHPAEGALDREAGISSACGGRLVSTAAAALRNQS